MSLVARGLGVRVVEFEMLGDIELLEFNDSHRDAMAYATPSPPRSAVRIDWRIAVTCAAGLTILFAIQNDLAPAIARPNLTLGDHVVLQLIIWFVWLALLPLIWHLARRAREGGRITALVVAQQILYAVGVSVLHSIVAGTIRWLLGVSVGKDFTTVIATSIATGFSANFIRFWLISGVYYGIAYTREVRDRDAREARHAATLAQARLESLEGRLHPHFLFNTLNAIAALIRDDPRAAERMVENLSELLRAALGAEPGREVSLERELELLQQYVAIQQARFRDRLHVSVDADRDALAAQVPHLILQPIVENAIRHGIAPRESEGRLVVRARRHGDVLRLLVQDDGVGYSPAKPTPSGMGIGITGTRDRLRHLYGDRFAFEIGSVAPTGTAVTIDIPFHTDVRPAPAVVESVA